MRWSALLLTAGMLFTAASAQAEEVPTTTAPPAEPPALPRRSGFTFEMGLGGSFMHVSSDPRVEKSKLGLAPLSFGIGGFFSRDVALTFRATGASLFQDRGGATEQVVLASYGPSLQYYVSEQVFIGGGIGVGLLAGNPFANQGRGVERIAEAGFAGHTRVGWAFFASKAHQLSLSTEAIHARTGEVSSTGVTLALGWQYF